MVFLFFVLLAIHFTLILITAYRILGYSKPTASTSKPPVSVVVAAKDEAKGLDQLLPALLSQKYSEYEVVVVLDRCKDASEAIVKRWNHPKLQTIEVHKLPAGWDGKKYALTRGIEAARHEWILLTDADCIPAGDRWIESFSTRMDDTTQIILGVGGYHWRPGFLNAFIRYETFQTAFHYIGSAILGRPYMGVGRNLAYRKSLFMEQNGFQNIKHIRGGDDDLFVQQHAHKANTQVIFSPDSLTLSEGKRTIRSYFQQKKRHFSVGKYYRSGLKFALSFNAVIHLLVWLSFLYLMVVNPTDRTVLGVFCVLMVAKSSIFSTVGAKMGLSVGVLWTIIVDGIYALLMPIIGSMSALVKRVRWK